MPMPLDMNMVIDVGGDLFGQRDLAIYAVEEVDIEVASSPVILAWDIFIEEMKLRGLLSEAFANAWPKNGVVSFVIGRGLNVQDAEEVSQLTAITASKRLETWKPWIKTWKGWLLMIAKGHINNHLKRIYREANSVNPFAYIHLDTITIRNENEVARYTIRDKLGARDSTFGTEDRGWSIPIICNEWIESGDEGRARFASLILAAYYGISWTPPTSEYMMQVTGWYKKKCYLAFQEFILEVQKRESKY